MGFEHKSVLLEETINGLNIRPDGTYVDGTLGGGGHAYEIARRLSDKGSIIGIDQDAAAIEDCLNAGISLITSMHGNCREDAAASKIGRLLDEKAFRYVVILSHTGGPGTVKEVLDV